MMPGKVEATSTGLILTLGEGAAPYFRDLKEVTINGKRYVLEQPAPPAKTRGEVAVDEVNERLRAECAEKVRGLQYREFVKRINAERADAAKEAYEACAKVIEAIEPCSWSYSDKGPVVCEIDRAAAVAAIRARGDQP